MQTSDHVHLGDAPLQSNSHFRDNVVMRKLKRMCITFARPKCAKLARENANIRIINVQIPDVSRHVPIDSLSHNICDRSNRIEVPMTHEFQSLRLINPATINDLAINGTQF